MKKSGYAPVNAALFHFPETARPARGGGFLKGFVRHSGVDVFHCHARDRAHVRDFEARVTAWDMAGRRTEWIPLGRPSGLRGPGCLFVPGPAVDGFAWRRRVVDERAYSLCGVAHGIAADSTLDTLGALLTAPVQPWDAVVCPSQAIKDSLKRLLGAWGEWLGRRTGGSVRADFQMPVIPDGVDCDAFAATDASATTRQVLRRRLGIGDDAVVVLSMGPLAFQAEAHPLPLYLGLEEAARHSGRHVHLIQAGRFADPDTERQFRDAARRHGPSVSCHFLDSDDPALQGGIWFAADIFVSLADNIREVAGLAPVEAMAAGLPVVVSDWGGFRDGVRHGIDGFTVPSWMPAAGAGTDLSLPLAAEASAAERALAFGHYCGAVSQCVAIDVASCARALTSLVAEPGLRRRMGAAGQKRARETFDWRAVIAAHQALWLELAAVRATTRTRAPRRDGEPFHPLRPDPFALFGGFSSDVLADDRVVGLAPGGTRERMASLRSLPMNDFAAPVLLTTEEREAVLGRLAARGPVSVSALAALFAERRRPAVLRTLGWMAKVGLVQVTAAAGAARPPAAAERAPAAGNETARAAGLAARRRGNLVAAAEYLEKALAEEPDDAEANNALGEILAVAGKLEAAVECFHRAVRSGPMMVAAHRNLGKALFLAGREEAAVESFRRATRLAPGDPTLWYVLGSALRRGGRVNEALQCLEKAMALDRKHTGALYQVALACRALGGAREAAQVFRELLRLEPGHPFALAAEASRAAAIAAPERLAGRRSARRIGLMMNHRHQYATLRPLFDRLTGAHWVLLTADPRELADFRPEVVVVCDNQWRDLRALLPEAVVVNVRYGPLFELGEREAVDRLAPDIACVTSEQSAETVAARGGLARERLWVTGYVPMDPLFRDAPMDLPLAVPSSHDVVVYTPHFNPTFSSAGLLGERVAEWIRGRRSDVTVILKPYPDIARYHPQWIKTWRRVAGRDPHFHLIDDPGADATPYLGAANAMVSDGSSLVYQYLAVDHPVVLVRNPSRPESLDRGWRDLGEEVSRPEDLAAAVGRALDDPELGADRRQRYFWALFGGTDDGGAAARIAHLLGRLPRRRPGGTR